MRRCVFVYAQWWSFTPLFPRHLSDWTTCTTIWATALDSSLPSIFAWVLGFALTSQRKQAPLLHRNSSAKLNSKQVSKFSPHPTTPPQCRWWETFSFSSATEPMWWLHYTKPRSLIHIYTLTFNTWMFFFLFRSWPGIKQITHYIVIRLDGIFSHSNN